MKICIFEDFSVSGLSPVNYLRHTSELISGALTLGEKTGACLKVKHETYFHCRKYLEMYCKEKFSTSKVNILEDGSYLFLNARVIYNKSNIRNFILKNEIKENNTAWVSGETIIAFTISGDMHALLNEKLGSDDNLISITDIQALDLKIINVSADEFKIINYPSDLILFNEEELRNDLKHLAKKGKKGVYISPKCKIHKSAVLDSSHGDIFIGRETTIEPFSYITGPCYIGGHTLVRAGSQIYGPVRIGDNCKVSGEITSSIIHSYVNKQHLGFLGHSYLCEWINLGAGTTTSNLKNNYAKISLNIEGKPVNTNSIFLGSIIGDHTKTGIQTMMNTGSLIGISCNVYGAGYHRNLIKSFAWDNADNDSSITYLIEKAVSTAKISMKRRNVDMSETYENLLRHINDIKENISV